jgi:hypothetical protein
LKQNKFAFITAALLGSIALWFYLNNDKGTIDKSFRNFAVKEIESVDKIILKKKNIVTTLERSASGPWMVNGKYVANSTAIKSLLYTIKNIDIKEPVSKNEQSERISELLEQGILCEIYQNNMPAKAYYVGEATKENNGTFMVLANPQSNEPYPKAFVNCIPGVENNLVPNYKVEEREWRDHSVFSYQAQQITSVKFENPNHPELGYQLFASGDNVQVKMIVSGQLLSNIDASAVKQYLYYFEQLNFESYAAEYSENQLDSIKKSSPLSVLTVSDNTGKTNRVQFYQIPNSTNQTDKDGKLIQFDPEHLLALLDNGKDLVILKYYEFGKVLPVVSYFVKK